ncbi:MAG: hypothetical protein Q9166_006033 [cf. Caloplaca sp. 2 TL-2023]
MDEGSFTTHLPPRRRPSIFSRARSRSNKMPAQTIRDAALSVHEDYNGLPEEEKDVLGGGMDTTNNTDMTSGTAHQTLIRRKPRASFSGFSHAMSDLRAFPKRIASQRKKSPLTTNNTSHSDINYVQHNMPTAYEKSIDEPSIWEEISQPHPYTKGPGWLRRCVSTTFRHRRRTFDTPSRPATAKWTQNDTFFTPVPVIGVAPPALPENGTGGAAARAAAAAQNEMLDYLRKIKKERNERKVRGDSESGVGIDTRPMEIETTMARLDPFNKLPEELFTQVLSYLDAQSLINSELVSRQWHSSATDTLVWKQVFHSDFRPHSQTIPENSSDFQVGGLGLGNTQADQDWKRMWKVRKALHQRWTDSHAAAIYLEGHYDSVYCVQFDEDKILTGSRDRTIRIWDARTYRCTRLLGVPSRSTPIALPPLTRYSGSRPFTKLFSQQFKIEPESMVKPVYYHVGSVLCLQYDDSLMITGSSDCTCIVWDIKADWKPIQRVRYHTAGVLDVCFDKKHVVSCSKDTTVCLWDRHSHELIHKLNGHRGPVNAVQLRGNLAVSASGDGVAKLWNLLSGNCVKEFPSKDRGMACVEFSPDSLTIFAGGNDQVIYQFDASTGELLREYTGHSGLVRSLHLDSTNSRIVSGSYDTSVRAYDIRTGNPLVDFTGWTASWILSAKLDYRRIIATSQDSRVVVIDFGYNLPGTELLERQYRPSVNALVEGMARLRVES